MLGLRFIKTQPTTYLLQYRGNKLVREGAGLSFFYYAPTTSLVSIPVASVDIPYMFEEVTADFQDVTIQPGFENACSTDSPITGNFPEPAGHC